MRVILIVAVTCLTIFLFGSYIQPPSAPRLLPPLEFINRAITSGNISATIYSVPSDGAGRYRVSQYLNPRTTNAVATVTGTVSWTENGTGKSLGIATLVLLLATNFMQDTMIVYVDASTDISYSNVVVGLGGTYDLRIVLEKL